MCICIHTHTLSLSLSLTQVGDPNLELLPQEWSDFVEKKQKWAFWGYNKDRVRAAAQKEQSKAAGPAEGSSGGKRARGRPRKEDGFPRKKEGAEAAGDAAAGAGEEDGQVKRLMEQMRGAETGFYVGCPVEVNYRLIDK